MRRFLSAVLALQLATSAAVPGVARAEGKWRSRTDFGLWWNNLEARVDGRDANQPGLLSLAVGKGGDYDLDPLFIGVQAELFAPQILAKSVGLGIFYFFCFFLTAGNCKARPSFKTGDRDAGLIDVGAHVGYSLRPVPLRLYLGPDLGLFYSGLTDSAFSTLLMKAGGRVELSDDIGLDLTLRKSVMMNEWDFGRSDSDPAPSLWLMSLTLSLRM